MNLEDSDKFAEAQKLADKKKKIVLISIVLCMILIALLVILIIYIRYLDSLQLKLYIDGEQKPISSTLFISKNNTNYVNIEEVSELLGYIYTKGEYEKYNENEDSCYVKNDLEVTAISANLQTFTKYINVEDETTVLSEEGPYGTEITVKSDNGKFNTFTLEKPIEIINNELYMPFDILRDVYNVTIDISEQNRIRIYTLPVMFKNAMEIASKAGYTNVSGIYENIRAIPYGLIILGNGKEFGVIDYTQNNKEILSVKYENLEFIQNTKEFFMTAGSTVGLLDSDGKTIIKPMEYDEISILDEVKQLYLVKKDGKYGVLNRKGEIIVHVDYERIGLKDIEKFGSNIESIRNTSLLFDDCIVVEANGKYGIFDITGKELLNCNYEALGYIGISSKDNSSEENVLIIPEEVGIKGIVICYDGLYGIYDANANAIIIPCACSRIYSVKKLGTTTYYMEFNGEQIELNNYLVANDLKSIGKTENKNITETNDNDSQINEESQEGESEYTSRDESSFDVQETN